MIDYHEIAERDHTIMNPTSPEKLERLIDYCRVGDGISVLDIGCGKGWLLRRMAERAAIVGVGVDTREAFLTVARSAVAMHPPKGTIQFHCMPARAFNDAGRFDITLCIGAPFAIGTFDQAVDWLHARTKSGGVLAIGDIFARKRPWPEVLQKAFGDQRTMAETANLLERKGTVLTGVIETSVDDWNHYESQHFRAIEEWARANPDHPQKETVLERTARSKQQFLELERDYLGWAIWVCRLQ